MTDLGTERYQLLDKLSWMRRVRFFSAVFVFAIYSFVKVMNVLNFPFVPFAVCCALEGIVNQPYPFITRRFKSLTNLVYVHLLFDVIAISAVIHFLGGVEFAFFSAAYPLIIVLAGIMISRKACYAAATFSSAAYAAVIAFEYFGLVPHVPLFGMRLDWLHQLGIVAANILFFYFVAFLAGLSSDVIEEKAEKLEKEKKFSDEVLATIIDGLVVVDAAGRVKEANRTICGLTGLSREELVGFSIYDKVIPGASAGRFLRAIGEVGSVGQVLGLEVPVINKDGRETPTSVNISMLEGGEKEGKSYLAIFRDLTKNKAMEKLKNEFVSTITHELMTPLTSIVGFAKLMVEKRMGEINEQQNASLGLVLKQAIHLKELVESLLDFSRLETGRLELHLESVRLADMIGETIAEMEPQIREKSLSVRIAEGPEVPPVLADVAKLRRAFLNLLGNAVKFTPSGRSIEVGLKEEKGFVSVTIRDEGIGIPSEHFENIFERFFQVDDAMTKVVGGAGLGLSIAKEIIEKHGGKIWAESDGLGRGSKFIFTLPVA